MIEEKTIRIKELVDLLLVVSQKKNANSEFQSLYHQISELSPDYDWIDYIFEDYNYTKIKTDFNFNFFIKKIFQANDPISNFDSLIDDERRHLIKIKIIKLLDANISEKEQDKLDTDISRLSPDKEWSYYIFHSMDYYDKDGDLNIELFLNKIFGQ